MNKSEVLFYDGLESDGDLRHIDAVARVQRAIAEQALTKMDYHTRSHYRLMMERQVSELTQFCDNLGSSPLLRWQLELARWLHSQACEVEAVDSGALPSGELVRCAG